MITASKLSPQLSEAKKILGLTLIKFEDASIDFEKFTDKHHFETQEVYLRVIKAHYKQVRVTEYMFVFLFLNICIFSGIKVASSFYSGQC